MRLDLGSALRMLACVVSLSLMGVYSASCSGDKDAEGAELGADDATEQGDAEKPEKKTKKGKKGTKKGKMGKTGKMGKKKEK